jgi:hypothetical protein
MGAFKNTTCRHCGVNVEYPKEDGGQMSPCPKCGKNIILIENAKGGVEKTAMREIGGSAPSSASSIFYAAKPNPPSEPIWGRIVIIVIAGWLVVLTIGWLSYGHWHEIGNGIFGIGIFIVLAAISLAIYFLPTYIAVKRHHKNILAILVLNLLLGWTFLGWVVSLVWALKND